MNLFKKIKEAEEAKPATKKSFTKSIAITAVLLVVMTAASTAWITTAWFAKNRDVDSNGMSMDVEVSSNLVIAKTTANIQTLNWTGISVDSWTTENAQNSGKFLPATHDNAAGTLQLKYCNNPGDVSLTKGYAKDGKTLAFTNVTEAAGNDSMYYRDYVVYIASSGKEFSASKLEAKLTGTVASGKDYQNAVSVDFWLAKTKNATPAYIGTRNLLNQATKLDLLNGVTTTIPLNTSDYMTVIMRFYYDGALQKSGDSTTAYINSAEVTTGALDLSVTFTATDAPAA